MLSAGYCGLTDGSSNGDWRLPNIKDLQSLIDFSHVGPALKDNPFINCESCEYWSSTTDIAFNEFGELAWHLNIFGGYTTSSQKATTELCVWFVRGGQ